MSLPLRSLAKLEPELQRPPETMYARSGDVNIAYQVIGDAPLDLDLRDGLGFAPRILLARAELRALPAATRVVFASDSF